MKEYLKKVNIVGAVIMYRCFEVNQMCLDNLLENSDRVLILLDNYDAHCKRKVLEFQERNKNVDVIYSKVDNKGGSESGKMYRRLVRNINPIREQLLRHLEVMNKKEKIDILIHLDPDEIFCKEIPEILTKFWESDKTSMFCGMMSPFHDFKTLWEPSMYPHARIYKYRTDITSIVKPRHRDFYRPYEKELATSTRYCIFHLPYLDREYRAFRDFRNGRAGERKRKKLQSLREKLRIYCAPRDVRTMTRTELRKLLRGRPSYNFGDFLDKFNIKY